MADAELLKRAKTLLDQLSATPRFAGSPEEGNARALCKGELERAGFSCTEMPFEFSQGPGRWGPPVAAAFQAATILLVGHMAVHHGPLEALVVGAVLVCALIWASSYVKRRGISGFPFRRSGATNLQATRGTPVLWLVAHIDSKSQTVPILVRILSSILLAVISAAALLVILLSLAETRVAPSVWYLLAIAAVVAALPSIFCFVRNDSPGALDNASGVATVLIASQLAPAVPNLGILVTSGEELGLAGARVWASSVEPGILVINCDTVDDAGGWRCMYNGAAPERMLAAAETVAAELGLAVAPGRMIPGILADSMAFADRGIEAVTISRGNLSTLARIHTRRDTSIGLTGSGVVAGAALLSALAKELA